MRYKMVEQRIQDGLRKVAAAGGYRLNRHEFQLAEEKCWDNLCAGFTLSEALWRAVYQSKGLTLTYHRQS